MDTIIPRRGYMAVDVYDGLIDSGAVCGERGGKVAFCTFRRAAELVGAGMARWAFAPRIDFPGTLIVRKAEDAGHEFARPAFLMRGDISGPIA